MNVKEIIPPMDLDAEEAVVSSLFVDGNSIINISFKLQS